MFFFWLLRRNVSEKAEEDVGIILTPTGDSEMEINAHLILMGTHMYHMYCTWPNGIIASISRINPTTQVVTATFNVH